MNVTAWRPDPESSPLLVLAEVADAAWPVTVTWGDGGSDRYGSDDDDIEHTYRQGGAFNVTATDAAGEVHETTVTLPHQPGRVEAFTAGDPKGDADNVVLGPGLLYVGATTVADPVDATTALPTTDFRPVGYTDEGSSFTYETSSEDVTVAEENDPVRTVPTATTSTLAFSMAEMTWENLLLALNQGASAGTVPPTAPTLIEPVAPGEEERVKIVWDSDYGSRWIFRKCVQTGSLTIDRKKAPDKGLLPVEFTCERPAGAAPFGVIPSADGLV
jgi:hypothetical protein